MTFEANSDQLSSAAGDARSVLLRVAGEGGVLEQIERGELPVPEEDAGGAVSLLAALREKARYTRSVIGGALPTSRSHLQRIPVVEMGSSSLPLNRKERYFTGTVLPMIVAQDGFEHLGRFLGLCGLAVTVPSGLDGDQRLQFFTEYSFAESVYTEHDRSRFPTRKMDKDTPDLVVVGDDWLLAVEAKMFHNPTAADLNNQMAKQDGVVRYIAERLNIPARRVRHVLLLPRGLSTVGVEAEVVLWEDVLDAYRMVGPRYWVGILGDALERHDLLVSKTGTWGANKDGDLAGADIRARYSNGTLEFTHMGRLGGLDGSELAKDLADGGWRTREYEVRHEAIVSPNWFSIAAFVERLQEQGF